MKVTIGIGASERVSVQGLSALLDDAFPGEAVSICVEADYCGGDTEYRFLVVHDDDPFCVLMRARGLRSEGATRASVAEDLRSKLCARMLRAQGYPRREKPAAKEGTG